MANQKWVIRWRRWDQIPCPYVGKSVHVSRAALARQFTDQEAEEYGFCGHDICAGKISCRYYEAIPLHIALLDDLRARSPSLGDQGRSPRLPLHLLDDLRARAE